MSPLSSPPAPSPTENARAAQKKHTRQQGQDIPPPRAGNCHKEPTGNIQSRSAQQATPANQHPGHPGRSQACSAARQPRQPSKRQRKDPQPTPCTSKDKHTERRRGPETARGRNSKARRKRRDAARSNSHASQGPQARPPERGTAQDSHGLASRSARLARIPQRPAGLAHGCRAACRTAGTPKTAQVQRGPQAPPEARTERSNPHGNKLPTGPSSCAEGQGDPERSQCKQPADEEGRQAGSGTGLQRKAGLAQAPPARHPTKAIAATSHTLRPALWHARSKDKRRSLVGSAHQFPFRL